MFDIGFSELLVIAVVALIVIGPERLPKVARTLGHLFGRMQRYVNDVKADIAREMELDELKKMQSSMEDAARSFQSSVSKEMSDAEGELNKLTQDAEAEVGAHAGDTPAQQEPAVATATAPQQRELALDANPPTPAQKQA
jgi:sec-independent protein translocase protein TatB